MKRRFLIFAIYESDADEVFALNSILECDNFPTRDEATKHMQSIAFSRIKGITGIIELSEGDKWE